MRTAIDWLLNEISATDWWYLPQSMKQDIIQQAKAMEKEQIQSAYIKGYTQSSWGRHSNSEQYYNETFKQQENEL